MHWSTIREMLRLEPSYSEALLRLRSAIESGELSVTTSLKSNTVERVLGFDSLDKVVLVMGCEELGMRPQTVGDLIRLLELMDRHDPPNGPTGPPPMHPLPVTSALETAGVKNLSVKSREVLLSECGFQGKRPVY